VFFVLKGIKSVLSNLNDNKLKLRHLFICSSTALMLDWKSTIFESVIATPESSAKRICKEFTVQILGRSLINTTYI
jgi:hypothetical protein